MILAYLHPVKPDDTEVVLFEPFFVRAALSLIFNLFILLRECGGNKDSIRWGSLCFCFKRRGFSPENLPLSSYDYYGGGDSSATLAPDAGKVIYKPRQAWLVTF